jgi:hypothetical protein
MNVAWEDEDDVVVNEKKSGNSAARWARFRLALHGIPLFLVRLYFSNLLFFIVFLSVLSVCTFTQALARA